jgi:hypothetical protein
MELKGDRRRVSPESGDGAGIGRAVYGRDGGTGPTKLAAALPGPGAPDRSVHHFRWAGGKVYGLLQRVSGRVDVPTPLEQANPMLRPGQRLLHVAHLAGVGWAR